MLVTGRSPSGQVLLWRIGRQRMAWRSPRAGLPFFELRDQWASSLMATLIEWPRRVVTGRWPVVAYVLDPYDSGILPQVVWVDGRAEADRLARAWVLHVQQHGVPPATGLDRTDRGGDQR